MFISRENERLHLNSWEYNSCRLLTELARLVESYGGRVKPTKTAIIINRNLDEKLHECEKKKNAWRKFLADGIGDPEKVIEAISNMEKEIETMRPQSHWL